MSTTTDTRWKFNPGRVVIARHALAQLTREDVLPALWRHVTGDWGELDEHDWQENELSLKEGYRLLSRYHATDGTVFWIITERDRSVTTILLPEEY